MRKLLNAFWGAFWFFAFAALVIVSCLTTESAEARARRERPPFAPVRLWVQSHHAFNHADVIAACAYWCRQGISCQIVDDERLANAFVFVDSAPCVSENGLFHLADASFEPTRRFGVVNVRVACYMNPLSPYACIEPYDRVKFRSVFAHELGHEFGMWEHVPESCGESHATHRSGVGICGGALMNATLESSTLVPTSVDDLAFDVRNVILTVLRIGSLEPPVENVCPR